MSIKRSKRVWEKMAQNDVWINGADKLELREMSVEALCEFNLSVHGKVVLQGDTDYNEDRQESNPAFQAYPLMIIYCAVASDVRYCLELAKTYNLWVALRSGGHSTAGYSVNSGIVIERADCDMSTSTRQQKQRWWEPEQILGR